MPTILELKRMARRHNRKTHIGVAQSKNSLERALSVKSADMSPPDMGSHTPYRRKFNGRVSHKAADKPAAPIPKPKRKPPPPPTTIRIGPAYNTRNKKKKGGRRR